MELFEAIHHRRTIRDFEHQDISEEDITKMLDAAFCAPTNDHMLGCSASETEDRYIAGR